VTPASTQLLVVAPARELDRPGGEVRGDAGGLSPEEREVLDWLALARLSGWPAAVGGPAAGAERWIVLACDPEELSADDVALLGSRLDEPLVVVARAAGPGDPLAALAGAARATASFEGRQLEWHGPGPAVRWTAREPVTTALEPLAADCQTWATLDGAPLVCARRVGAGVVVTLGFHPSRARDADGAVTAILRRALVSGAPAAWLDLGDTLVLRMDGTGGPPSLDERGWETLFAELRARRARLSVAYAPDARSDGAAAAALTTLRTEGLGEVELHGRTDAGPQATARSAHPLELGLGQLQRLFGVRPTTFVPAGDRFGPEDVEAAFRLGFSFVESYRLALRDGDRFLWTGHVPAPYLDLAAPEWLLAGLPVVGSFRDGDVAVNGIEWLRRHLDAWAAAGAARLIDFRKLASALALDLELGERDGRQLLTVTTREDAPQPLRPIPIRVVGVESDVLDVLLDGRGLALPVRRRGSGARVLLPARAWTTSEAAVRDRDPLDAERRAVGRERAGRRAGG
jgi:hypothetical protein